MTTLSKTLVSLSLAAALYTMPSFLATTVVGEYVDGGAAYAEQDDKAEKKRKTNRVPAMRNRVYTHLSLAQKTGEEEGTQAGLAALDEIKGRIDQLNSYEKAMLWNFYGFMHYNGEDTPNALKAFENVVAIDAIPNSLRLSTLRSIAQLHMSMEDYNKALEYLDKWKSLSTKELSATDHVLYAQSYYLTRRFAEAAESIDQAIKITEGKNKLPKENWLVLQRASYYEMKQPEKVTEIMEKLVRLFNKPEYWVQLAGMYGEIGEEKKQLAVMEAAWQAGYISKGTEMVTLAQLYLYHNVPFKAAKVMEEAMKGGSLKVEEKHYQLVSQAYMMAKNDDLAIIPLQEAAQIAEHGNFDAQLAEIYVNTEQWVKALEAAANALSKGNLNNPGNVHMAVGMANYNMQRYEQSLYALAKAKEFQKTQNMATQWIAYVSKEQHTAAQRGVF